MFIKELQLYLDYLREQITETLQPDNKFIKYCSAFGKNLVGGIAYYQELIRTGDICSSWKCLLEKPLTDLEKELEALLEQNVVSLSA